MKQRLMVIVSILIIFLLATIYLFDFNKDDEELTKIRLAEVTHSIFYSPQYVAIHNGYFKDEGINIELILTPGADKVTAAVLSGDVDIGFCGSEATIYVYKGDEKDYLKTFAQLTQKDGSFLVSRKDIKDFKLIDLKGKTIIGGRAQGMPEMTFEWALRENGIDPKKDVKIDTSIAFAAMEGAFIGGVGDFVTLFEPNALNVEKQGKGFVVASIGELGGTIPYTAYNARTSYIEENEDLIEKFTRAIQKGLDFIHDNDSNTIAKSIQVEFPDTTFNDLVKIIDRYKSQDTWPTNTTLTEESFEHLQEIMMASGAITETVSYDDLIYTGK